MSDDLGPFCSQTVLVTNNAGGIGEAKPCGARRNLYRVTLAGREVVLCSKHMLEAWKDAESDAVKLC